MKTPGLIICVGLISMFMTACATTKSQQNTQDETSQIQQEQQEANESQQELQTSEPLSDNASAQPATEETLADQAEQPVTSSENANEPQNTETAPQSAQTADIEAADDLNGIIEYNEYEKIAEYSWCSALPTDCKRVSMKYEFKKRCLTDSDSCEYFQKDTYQGSSWKPTENIVSSSHEFGIGRTQEGVDQFMKVEDAFNDKGVKVKKIKYSIETKPMEIKVPLDDKTVSIESSVRKMCPIKKDNKVSSACDCYLMKDNCGNYVGKNGQIVYNKKYINAEGKTDRDLLEKDGCYLANHISERIACRKPVIED